MTRIQIQYTTGNLDIETVKTRVLQREKELSKRGYNCHWKGDLDPANPQQGKGYANLGGIITTPFEKNGLAFLVSISPEEGIAQINGDEEIDETKYDQVRKELDEFEAVTGIHFELLK
jgi:hypothetical protein